VSEAASFITLAIVAICTWFAFVITADKYEDLKKQAIERGYAEYVVDSDGKTTWQWKEEK